MEENKELTREERLELEEQAINTLISMGAKFSVPLKLEPRKAPWWIRTWNKLFPQHPKVYRDKRIPKGWDVSLEEMPDVPNNRMVKRYVRHFVLRPLYLGTIDMIRKESIEIEYNEGKIQENPVGESRKLLKYTERMARIIAIAVLNCSEVTKLQNRELKALQDFFVTHLTSAKLERICQTISIMRNSGGFTNSIRLILDHSETSPKADLVE